MLSYIQCSTLFIGQKFGVNIVINAQHLYPNTGIWLSKTENIRQKWSTQDKKDMVTTCHKFNISLRYLRPLPGFGCQSMTS